MINLIKIEYKVTQDGMDYEPDCELLAEHHDELFGHILDAGYGWILVGYLPSPAAASGVDAGTIERILWEDAFVNVEVGMVKVSFWLEDTNASGDTDDYVMKCKESDFIFKHRDQFVGKLDEFGGNYLILSYDTIENLEYYATQDAGTLKQLIEEYNVH